LLSTIVIYSQHRYTLGVEQDTKKGITLRPTLSTADLAGSGSKHVSVKEMKRKLDELRNEDL